MSNELQGVVIELQGRDAPTYGRIRTAEGGVYFLHISECDGPRPARLDRVSFVPDVDDRGPRARQIVVVERYQKPAETFTDRRLSCRVCSQVFTWSADEQETYRAAGLQNRPSACAPCRRARRLASRGW